MNNSLCMFFAILVISSAATAKTECTGSMDTSLVKAYKEEQQRVAEALSTQK